MLQIYTEVRLNQSANTHKIHSSILLYHIVCDQGERERGRLANPGARLSNGLPKCPTGKPTHRAPWIEFFKLISSLGGQGGPNWPSAKEVNSEKAIQEAPRSATICVPHGFEEVAVGTVALRVAFCIEFFKLFFFSLGGHADPKDYGTEVWSSLGNFCMMKNLISDFREIHLHFPEMMVSKSAQNNDRGGLTSICS